MAAHGALLRCIIGGHACQQRTMGHAPMTVPHLTDFSGHLLERSGGIEACLADVAKWQFGSKSQAANQVIGRSQQMPQPAYMC